MMSKAIRVVCAVSAAVALCTSARAEADPPTDETLPARGVVNAARLNVRRGPGVNPPIGLLPRDSEVIVRKRHDKWLEIDYPQLFGPWIAAICVEKVEGLENATEDAPVTTEVSRDRARVRSLPSRRGLMLDELALGAPVSAVGFVNGWYRIVPPSDLRVYVHSDYVKIVPGPIAKVEGPVQRPVPGAKTEEMTVELRGDVAEKIAFAAELLSAEGSLAQVENALELLEEAMASEELGDAGRAVARRKVADTIGALPPGRWLALLRLARQSSRKRLDDIDRRYAAQLRDARDSLSESPPIDFTAQGVLRVTDEIAGSYRVFAGDVLVCDLDSGGADLMPFVGKEVGIVGRRRDEKSAGGTPVIEVQYVEEVGPGDGRD